MNRLVLILICLILISCRENYTPKPRGFFKISFPEKEFQQFINKCPFTFKFPKYSSIESLEKDCFLNLNFPDYSSTLHISYFPIDNNLIRHSEESRTLAYKHSVKANSISEQLFVDQENKVFGIVYKYNGKTATALQFYLTDSIDHFFRGALYFNTEINDSIIPISNFLQDDIKLLIESFRWKSTEHVEQKSLR